MIYYTLWDNLTDEIIASGNAEECAKAMGMSVNTFRGTVSKITHKKIDKYSVIKQNIKKEEYL